MDADCGGLLFETGPGHIDENFGDMTEFEGKREAEFIDKLGAEGNVLNGDIAGYETDVHIVLDSIKVLAEVLDKDRLHDGGEHDYIIYDDLHLGIKDR